MRKLRTIGLLMILLFSFASSPAADKAKKIKPKVRMSYIHYSDSGPEVHVKAYYKPKEGGTKVCTGTVLSLMNSNGDILKTETVGDEAITKFKFTDKDLDFFADSAQHFYSFFVELDGGDIYKDKGADLEIWPSTIKAEFQEEDSTKTIRAVFEGMDDSGRILPIEDLLLKFYVKRYIFPLPIGGDNNLTNENGEADILFPNDLPGDEEGNVTVMIKLEEDDTYGTVVHRETLKWGQKLITEDLHNNRTLFSPGNNAPWFMVIIISAALIGVWGVMIWVVFNFFRIRKIGLIIDTE